MAAAPPAPPDPALGAAAESAAEDLGFGPIASPSPPLSAAAEEEIEYAVGDFVWGKIKHHPWWPGRVYDPAMASDHARNIHHKDHCLLVAYFGDDSFAWCEPAQLKPFTAAEFQPMANQNGAKNFLTAVRDAVDAVGTYLQSEIACHCIPDGTPVSTTVNPSITNYMPEDFLDRVRSAAVDAMPVDLLEVAMLRSWGLGFRKMPLVSGEFSYRRQLEIEELVDKIDIDALSIDLFGEEISQDESAGKEPEVVVKEKKRYPSRKNRTVAKVESDSEVSSGREKVEPKRRKSLRGNVAESVDDSGSGRRERKKSKYLSPPYTIPNGNDQLPDSPKSTDSESPKKPTRISRSSSVLESPRIRKSGSSAVGVEEEDVKSPVYKIGGTSTTDILSEFLATAINPLNLKLNRSAKTVREFFAAYRSSMYSSDSGFDDYYKELTAGSNTVVPEDRKVNGRKRRKTEDHEEATPTLGTKSTDHSEQTKSGSKRKKGKDLSNIEAVVDLNLQTTDGPDGGKTPKKKKTRKDHEPVSSGEAGDKKQKTTKGTRVSIQKSPTESRSAGGKSYQKKENGHDKESLVDTRSLVTNGTEAGTPGQRRKREEATTYEGPTALLLTFAPGVTLPTKEHLISTFSRYGKLIESETDLAKKSGCARVVFVRSIDAEKALNSRNKSKEFGSPVPSYRLCHLSENMNSTSPQIKTPVPPLPSIKKGLQRLISTLTGSSTKRDAGSAEGLMPEVREDLVADMKGILKKVDKMLSPAADAPGSASK